jgi:hypothetical protein
MSVKDKRTHTRYDTVNLVSYVSYDADGSVSVQGMGRTLNLSQDGILLETHQPVETGQRISITLGLEDQLVHVDGTSVHCRLGHKGRYETGVRFDSTEKGERPVLSAFIQAFQKQEPEKG